MQRTRTTYWYCYACASLALLGGLTALAGTNAWFQPGPNGVLVPTDAQSARPPTVTVTAVDDTGLDVSVDQLGIDLASDSTPAGEFVRISCPDTPTAGAPGAPELPVVRRMFACRPNADVTVQVRESEPTTLDLQAAGFSPFVLPAPSGGKLSETAPKFVIDAASYASLEASPAERVRIRPLGLVRGQQIYVMEVYPVAYQPLAGAVTLWPRLDISLRFAGGDAPNPYIRPTAAVNRIVLNPDPAALQPGRTNPKYLVITPPDYSGSAPLNQFLNAKTAQGFDVSVYTTPSSTTAPTVKAYIQSLWGTPNTPDFVLIVGDALGWGTGCGTYYIGTFLSLYRPMPSDTPFVCMDGPDDWFPDIALGRIPVRSTSDLQIIVDKILYVENGNYADPSYTTRAIFVAGTDPDANAEGRHNHIIDTYMTPNRIQCNKVYVQSYGATTQTLKNAINAGCFLTVFFGHASGFQAWYSPLFGFSDIESLSNTNLYPCVLAYGCSTSAFWYTESTQSPGFLEKWMLVPNKGAAAGYGCSWSLGPHDFSSWGVLYNYLFEAMYSDGIRELGPAMQAAAAYFVAYYGIDDIVSSDWTNAFPLLGDPSMRLPEPPPQNYLIVAPSGFVGMAALNQFVNHKTSLGYQVSVYNVPAGTTRTTIRNHILSLWSTADAPSFVLIVGDTPGTGSSTSLAIPHWTGGGSKAAVTDWPYGCMSDPNTYWYRPEIPVGRFPVTSETQLQSMVDRTIHVETGTYADPNCIRRIAFAVNPDTYNTGEPTADWIITNYLQPNGYQGIPLYAAQGASSADVINTVNNGCMFLTYMGHSSSSGWWDPAITQNNVRSLTNANKYPVVAGWSCNTSHFDYDECFGETWVRQANKGAAAYISASNYIYWGSIEDWEPSGVLERAMFAAYFEDNLWHLGPAWLSSLQRFLNEYGDPNQPGGPPTQHTDVVRNFFEEFVILGDPALRIPRPDAFRVRVSPALQNVCSPPDNTAMFTISVQKMGNFSEPVVLSAHSLPPNAAVNFANNNRPPPFTSVMTVSNLTTVAPGAYVVSIHGDAASESESATASLVVSSQPPPVPTPTAPLNGAGNVSWTPTLAWTPVAGAVQYDVEVSAYPYFPTLVFGASVTQTDVVVTPDLEAGRTYYWHVSARNACGASDLSSIFQFTTTTQRDYLSEQFTTGDSFDLANTTLYLIPDGSANYYRLCSATASDFPTNPSGSTTISGLGDDGSAQISFASPINLFGTPYTSLYVNANGNLTFGSGDSTWTETLTAHFSRSRISALFDDLNPGAGGSVSWKQLGDRIAITFSNVPEVTYGGSCSFQFELFFNGEIDITYLGVTSTDGIAGLSAGGGLPADFLESDLSSYGPCLEPGACCLGAACTVQTSVGCAALGGTYLGDTTSCTPNPCTGYQPGCLIISEVVQGAESGDCPRFIEITNTGLQDFVFFAGGLIVQTGSSSDLTIDLPLAGTTIAAGQSFVVVSTAAGGCTGAFQAIFGFPPDLSTTITFGYGDERFLLTDRADSSHIIDMYGQFGVDGTGTPWEFTRGYAYRLPQYIAGFGKNSSPAEWVFGGVGSLSGPNPTDLLLAYTTPGTHTYAGSCQTMRGDLDGDGDVDATDLNAFGGYMAGAGNTPPPNYGPADLDSDGDVDLDDAAMLQLLATHGGY